MRNALRLLGIILIIILLFSACERTERKRGLANTTSTIDSTTSSEALEKINIQSKGLKIKLYIENSGSMFGYVNGRTQLKDMLQNLLVDLKYEYNEENIEIYFVNTKIYNNPIKSDVKDFADKLSPYSIKIGQTGSSDLNDIFRQITSEIEGNSISILISDFIYSIKKGNTVNLLGEQQALTKDVFLTADKKGLKLTTNVYQYSSDYDGKYYDFNDDGKPFKGQRPYYLAVIGEQSTIKQFTNQIGLKFPKYKGYSNEYLLTAEDFKVKDFTVLTSTLNNGRIKPIRGTDVNGQVRQIEVEESGRGDSTFQMTIAVDLSALAITEDYITDITNYQLNGTDFALFAIGKIVGNEIVFSNGEMLPISKADQPHVQFGATHAFVFQSTNASNENLSFSLKRNIPKWVTDSSLLDDTDLTSNESKQKKTFGLDYLINGISEAYLQATKKDNYFNINISIEKPKSSSFGGKVVGIIFLLLLIALIIRVILKRKTRK